MDMKRRSLDSIHNKTGFLEAPKRRNSYMTSASTDVTKSPESNMLIMVKHQNFFDGKESITTVNPIPNLKMAKLNNCWTNSEDASVSLASKNGESPVRNGRAALEKFFNGSSSPLNESPKDKSVRRKLSDEPGVASASLKIIMRRNERYATQQEVSSTGPEFRKKELFELENNLKKVINNDDPIEFNGEQEFTNKKMGAKLGLKNIRKLQQSTAHEVLQSKESNSGNSNSNERYKHSNTLTEETKDGKKKWNKLVNVFQSVLLFQREEVKSIADVHVINHEIHQFRLRDPVGGRKHGRPDLSKEEFAKDAFQDIRRKTLFTECAFVGSPKHKEMMSRLILDDPRRYLLSPDDPNHFLNVKDTNGHTPLYIAAKNGNLEVVKLLVENKANALISSKVSSRFKQSETALETAVKWNHPNVVQYLLEKDLYPKLLIRKCLKYTTNRVVRSMLEQKLGITGRSKNRTSLFSCFYTQE